MIRTDLVGTGVRDSGHTGLSKQVLRSTVGAGHIEASRSLLTIVVRRCPLRARRGRCRSMTSNVARSRPCRAMGAVSSRSGSRTGEQVAYRGTRGGRRNLYTQVVDGSGAEEQLTTGEHMQTPSSVSSDGQWVAYAGVDPQTGPDVWMLPLDGSGPPVAVARAEYSEQGGAISPDGSWVAFNSSQSSQNETLGPPVPRPGCPRSAFHGRHCRADTMVVGLP